MSFMLVFYEMKMLSSSHVYCIRLICLAHNIAYCIVYLIIPGKVFEIIYSNIILTTKLIPSLDVGKKTFENKKAIRVAASENI